MRSIRVWKVNLGVYHFTLDLRPAAGEPLSPPIGTVVIGQKLAAYNPCQHPLQHPEQSAITSPLSICTFTKNFVASDMQTCASFVQTFECNFTRSRSCLSRVAVSQHGHSHKRPLFPSAEHLSADVPPEERQRKGTKKYN